MAYLFLSYAKADRETAFTMREVLQKEGFLVWMDENETEPKNHQWKEIEANIFYAGAFVLLMSDAAKQSDSVQRELHFAKASQRLILPIVIQGEVWEGFAEKAIPLHVGLRLDIPDERIAEIKHLLKNQPDSDLPPPLPDAALEAEQQKRFLLWFGIIAIILIAAIRIGIYYHSENLAYLERATNAAHTQEQLELTRLQTQQMATETAAVEQVTQTAMSAAIGTRSALARVATENYQSSMASTAQSGNGVLPCGASIRVVDGSFNIRIYVQPSFNSFSWMRGKNFFTGTKMIVSEWIVNDDGVWYRISTESIQNYGYVLDENLLLDDECPR